MAKVRLEGLGMYITYTPQTATTTQFLFGKNRNIESLKSIKITLVT